MVSIFRQRATGSVRLPDLVEVRRALALLADPDHWFELRPSPSWRSVVLKGSDLDGLCKAVQGMGDQKAVYFALNPLKAGAIRATVSTVLLRRWLLIDADPVRAEPDSNATDAEKEAARLLAHRVLSHLSSLGWPAPLMIDSGNGWHLLYRIDLPNDQLTRVLLKKLLHGLAEQFDTPEAIIDRAVHNAARISKLPGTWVRKGPHSKERPWRQSKLVFVPDEIAVVPAELLRPAGNDGASLSTPCPEPSSAFKLSAGKDSRQQYARKAMQLELAAVALAPERERNNTLNKAAFSLGQIIATGLLNEGEVEGALYFAARRAGLDESEILPTIRSGIAAGKEQPRVIPEKNGVHKPITPAIEAVKPGESIIIRANTVTPRKVEWLWPGRIPLGKLTTFAGQGGLGKTFTLCDIAARVTTGFPWPDAAANTSECTAPGQVLFISGEDEPDDTLVPRLIELGADLSKVAFLKSEVQDRFTLADLKTLETALEQMGDDVRFIAIDPPAAFLGDIDDHRNAEVRSLLSPLKSWAAKFRLSIVFNTHFTKSGGAKIEAMQRVMASVAWVNAVRAAHAFARDPEDPERVVFLPMKMNLAKMPKGLAFRLKTHGDLAKIEWLGEVDLTADQAVNNQAGTPRQKLATDWLIELFKKKLEWSSDDFWGSAKENGVSKNAINAARVKLEMPKPRKTTSLDGETIWTWWVPPDWPPLLDDDDEGEIK